LFNNPSPFIPLPFIRGKGREILKGVFYPTKINFCGDPVFAPFNPFAKNSSPSPFKESQREAKPLSKVSPPSFEIYMGSLSGANTPLFYSLPRSLGRRVKGGRSPSLKPPP